MSRSIRTKATNGLKSLKPFLDEQTMPSKTDGTVIVIYPIQSCEPILIFVDREQVTFFDKYVSI